MNTYVKHVAKKDQVEGKEKFTAIGHLAHTMVSHGEDFDNESEFGTCLLALGQANERLARAQDSYVASASSSFLEGLERSLAQLKEYQARTRQPPAFSHVYLLC